MFGVFNMPVKRLICEHLVEVLGWLSKPKPKPFGGCPLLVISGFLDIISASSRLRDLPWLTDTGLRVLVLFPADRHHIVACLTGGHNNTKLIRCC